MAPLESVARQATRSQPLGYPVEEYWLLLARNMDDGVKGDDCIEALGRELNPCHVRGYEHTRRDVVKREIDAAPGNINHCQLEMLRQRVCGRATCAAHQLEHGSAARQHLHQAGDVPGPLFSFPSSPAQSESFGKARITVGVWLPDANKLRDTIRHWTVQRFGYELSHAPLAASLLLVLAPVGHAPPRSRSLTRTEV
jgi:hypothetical protein